MIGGDTGSHHALTPKPVLAPEMDPSEISHNPKADARPPRLRGLRERETGGYCDATVICSSYGPCLGAFWGRRRVERHHHSHHHRDHILCYVIPDTGQYATWSSAIIPSSGSVTTRERTQKGPSLSPGNRSLVEKLQREVPSPSLKIRHGLGVMVE